MHIDFAPPSNGTYNNSGSSRQLANYMEHEDLERMEKGVYTEGFFNMTDDNIYKSKVIKDIDSNIGQLLKTDAKFYAIHVSPSEKELRTMGNTEQEQAEAMRRYIREVFIPEYAKNFNKELSASDIKFYGKVHFDRNRYDNELNMHCHLIVSRKDQANKVKISPLTNHRNTKKGVIVGGFDRAALFENVEKGFDKLFSYHRQLSEKFEYCNTMKNGPVMDKLLTQERELNTHEIFFVGEKKKIVDVKTDKNVKTQINKNIKTILDTSIQQQTSLTVNQSIHQRTDKSGLSSLLSILPSVTEIKPTDEQQLLKHKKKKKRRPRLS
ncbi:DUF5712 family protein [Bacteroides cellulosilyticus]|jgi:hypothetical protein|uniref:DUF5712 family protein n=1 Tax=Bacteroides cellulosilyticus TaxID=246787 RepID=UPI000E48BEFD|nr:DUF5712 family protein [Bacteroides cellulosilyticus]RGU25491.1 clindamycin resistance transfer factor BtgB [Bacteroides cellulosilyticus]